MEYRKLGRTSVQVSAIGLGGEGFERKSQQEIEEMIKVAFNYGINIIDIYNANPVMRSNV